jgi:hypothetical protein
MQIFDMAFHAVLSGRIHSAHSTSPSRFAAQCVNTRVNNVTERITVKLIGFCSTYKRISYKNVYLLEKDIDIQNNFAYSKMRIIMDCSYLGLITLVMF